MGIDQRDWYRQEGSPTGRSTTRLASWTVVTWLIVINVAAYLLSAVSRKALGWDPTYEGLGLKAADVTERFMVWQIVTSMFLHDLDKVGHLLINVLILFMFGRHVETRLGGRSFLKLYFGSGLIAGLAYVVFGLFSAPFTPAVGASGAVMGVLVYFTLLSPNSIVLLFFVIRMKMKWVTTLFISVDLYYFVFSAPGDTGVAHSAHLGGALFGFLFFRYAHRVGRIFLDMEIRARENTLEKKRMSSRELEAEVDRLLDKVREGGLDALSEKERKALKDASARLRDRDGDR